MLKVLGFKTREFDEIRPLLGINSGPTPFGEGEPDFVNVSRQYQQLGIESVRTEDLSNGSFDVMYFFRIDLQTLLILLLMSGEKLMRISGILLIWG